LGYWVIYFRVTRSDIIFVILIVLYYLFLDYGQVKRMELGDRIKYAKLIIALAQDDREEVVRLHFDELGVRTRNRNKETAYLSACFYHDRSTDDVTGGRDLVALTEALNAADPVEQLPEPYLLAMRGNLILRGVANVFGVQLRMSQMWKHHAQALLKRESSFY
jgi:predicted unusual protein kinase regulating ubiquinone biosynthesis (AarF/ABC1/UbiB family)